MRDWNEFDRQLMEDVGEMPPQSGAVNEFSPFGFAVAYIIAGLALTTITLHFFNLQYILPMVGSVLLYLGFRSLRRENRWFGACWILSALSLAVRWAQTVLLATPLAEKLQAAGPDSPAVLAGMLMPLALFFCFRQALNAVWKKVGREPERDPMLGAMVWYLVLLVLAYLAAGTVLGLLALVWYILILRSLWKAGESLEAVGYSLKPAPVRLSKGAVGRGMLLLTLGPVLVLSLLFSRPAMDWQARPDESAAHPELRQELLELGFPEQVLSDLSPEDLAGYEDARQVYAMEEVNIADSGLEMTTVYAITSDSSVRVLQWFHWNEMPAMRMGDGITCNLPMDDNDGAEDRWENFSGRVLYQRFGRTYAAPIPQLTWGAEEYTGWFGTETAMRMQARFSLPLLGSDLRGYVVYDYHHGPEKRLDGLSCNYYHQWAPVLYPWQELRGSVLGGGPYSVVQNYTNLYTAQGLQELQPPV